MAPVSPSMSRGVQALSDAEQLRMPGPDTRFAAGTLVADDRARGSRRRVRIDPRAWLAVLRRPRARAQFSH